MNTILSIIIQIKQNTFKTDNNYIIASYILKNIDLIESKSIQEVAQECYVSTNTVLRFCQLIGFNTYRRFKSILIATVKNRESQLKEKNKSIDPNMLLRCLIKFDQSSFDLDRLKSTLDDLIDEIIKYKVIHLYGATYPLALAQSFIEDMALLKVVVHVHQVSYSSKKIVSCDDGLHIIISYSGRFMEANRNHYREITRMEKPAVLISKATENLGDIDYLVQMPSTASSHYDDLALMIIYDYILINYYLQINHD